MPCSFLLHIRENWKSLGIVMIQCLVVVLWFILTLCPCVSLLVFQCLLCVSPPLCVSLCYLTCPPSSLTSPVPDPLGSVSVYLVCVLPAVFVSSFCRPSASARLFVMFCSVSFSSLLLSLPHWYVWILIFVSLLI